MANINPVCPNCGSKKVQLTSEKSKHGVLYLFIFGCFYVMWWMLKATIALSILVCVDIWVYLFERSQGKDYTFISKRMMSNKKRLYYCHECGQNFRA